MPILAPTLPSLVSCACGREVPDKILYWPIPRSPRIAELLSLPEWLVNANWMSGNTLGRALEIKLQVCEMLALQHPLHPLPRLPLA